MSPLRSTFSTSERLTAVLDDWRARRGDIHLHAAACRKRDDLRGEEGRVVARDLLNPRLRVRRLPPARFELPVNDVMSVRQREAKSEGRRPTRGS